MPVAYDVVVLGLGAMGAAATYQLARRGARVLGIDRYSPPHEFGSTHGDTRITRIACGEGPEYSAFAARSHQIWRELEAELGVDLLHAERPAGHLRAGEAARPTTACRNSCGATVDAAKKAKLDYEILDTAQIRARYPALNVADGDEAYHDDVGGFVRPERCVSRPAAKGQGPRRRSAPERDGHLLRPGGRLGHGEDGQGDLPRQGADRGGGIVAAGLSQAGPGRPVQGDSPGALLVPRQGRRGACAILARALSRLYLAGAGAPADLRLPRHRRPRGRRQARHRAGSHDDDAGVGGARRRSGRNPRDVRDLRRAVFSRACRPPA